ncbi:CAP domain-containing protein, partial [Georgenia sp. 10Sc9-8]|nr:CAP domain-containing protein [Georgenia halotolerans]
DWDGDGDDTFTVRRGIKYYVANAIRGGDADSVVTYGRSNDTALVGDWNGDRVDSLGVRRAPAPAESAVKSVVVYAGERGHLTSELNKYRSANGQHTLTRDSSLDEIAQGQAEWMAANRQLKHNPTYRQQMGGSWFTGSEIIVRNTGGMYMTTDAILSFMHNWWRNSPVHNENMLRGTFTHVGTGYYVGDNGVPYGVHVLGGKR